jgi:single-stranded DNA-binding protein
MRGLNKVMLIGNVGADPVFQTFDGIVYCWIANNAKYAISEISIII